MSRDAVRILLALAFVVYGAIAIYDAWDGRVFARRSPIAADLPSEIESANREFVLRVQDRFPIGSAEADLVQFFSAQGFRKPELMAYAGGAESIKPGGWMMLDNGPGLNLSCHLLWAVWWEIDSSRRLSAVNASHSQFCW
jgi:hypothetical protein